MEGLPFSAKRDSIVDQILTTPYQHLPLLFETGDSDMMVFMHDMERRWTYMSKSSWNVCKLDFKKWHRESIVQMLTEHPRNEIFKSVVDADLKPGQIQKLYCEIWDEEGGRSKLVSLSASAMIVTLIASTLNTD